MDVEMSWQRLEQPILEALAQGDGRSMSGNQLQAIMELETPMLMRALRSLSEDGYIDAQLLTTGETDYPIDADGIRLLPKGKRQAGLWPREDLAAAFLAAFEQAIRDESDDRKRSNMEKALDALKALGVMTLSAVIGQAVGVGASHL
jgi:DNA-binding PadR family transcriptional regulator